MSPALLFEKVRQCGRTILAGARESRVYFGHVILVCVNPTYCISPSLCMF